MAKLPKFEDLEELPSFDTLEEVGAAPAATNIPDADYDDLPYKEYGFLEGMGGGALQGASFGFADEIEAALRSGAMSGEDYERALEKSRAQYKQVTEQQPVADLIGNILGGVGTAAAMGPLGLAGQAAKGASLAKKVGSMAKAGAVGGALYGAGTSEDSDDLVEDVMEGAAGGAVAGAGMQVLGSGAKKVAGNFYDLLKNNSYIGDTVKTFQKTFSKRTDLVDDLTKLDEKSISFVDDFIGELQGIRKQTGQDMGAAYVKALDKSGKTIDTDELYTKLKSRLDELSPDDPEQAKVLKSVKGFLSEIVDLDKRNLKVIKDVGKRTPQEKGETALARQVAQARTKLGMEETGDLSVDQLNILRSRMKEMGYSNKAINEAVAGAGKFTPEKVTDVKTGLPVLRTEAPAGITDEGELTFRTLTKALDPEYTPIKFREGEVLTKELGGDEVSQLMADINRKMTQASPQERRMYGQILEDVKKQVRGTVDDPAALSEIDEATAKFKDIAEAQKALGLDMLATPRKAFTAADQKAMDAERQQLLRKISNFDQPASARLAETSTVKEKAIPALKRYNESLGRDVEDVMQEMSEDARLAANLGLESQIGGSRETLYASPKAFMMRGSAALGKTARDVADASKNVGEFARKLTGMSSDDMSALASRMEQSGNRVENRYGQMLREAVTAPQVKRKAILFSLLQNKDFRDAVSSWTPLHVQNDETEGEY